MQACDARLCPLLIVDAMDIPNDAVDLLLNALVCTKFAIVFPFVLDTRSKPELTSKILYLGGGANFYGTVGFMTIVSHAVFANAVCCSTLGGLGSIVKEFRLSEMKKEEQKEFFVRDQLLFFQLGAAVLEPKNCFLLSKILDFDTYSLHLSGEKFLSFRKR